RRAEAAQRARGVRHRHVRRVHGARRRPAHQLLPRPRGHGGRPRGPHPRRARHSHRRIGRPRRRAPGPDPGRVRGANGFPVLVLHARHPPHDQGAPRRAARRHRRGDPRVSRGQSVSVRELRKDPRLRARGDRPSRCRPLARTGFDFPAPYNPISHRWEESMPVRDLREWIERVDEIGELSRVDGADPEYELGGLVDLYQWDMGNPALLFDHIRGYRPGHRIVANVFTSLRRLAISLDLPLDYGPRDFVQAWRTQLKDLKPQPAVTVESGPVLENQQRGDAIDLTQFPAPIWHRDDGGRYIGTGNIVVMRDPDTGWVNSGTYRVQMHDAQTAGIYISPGKHGRLIRDKYWSRGEACPVAVCVGQDPLLLLLGGLEVDYGTNEYDVAGAIRRKPIELISAPYTGLPVPATAEIVLEGEIPPGEMRSEGPFGEWTGYYASGEKDEPIIRVR